ncbi:Uncharacterized protein Rs2_27260 [Raphanus sativus]|nr:Uncharacterized protein Rs2_27260 [Raphanus sativus]
MGKTTNLNPIFLPSTPAKNILIISNVISVKDVISVEDAGDTITYEKAAVEMSSHVPHVVLPKIDASEETNKQTNIQRFRDSQLSRFSETEAKLFRNTTDLVKLMVLLLT